MPRSPSPFTVVFAGSPVAALPSLQLLATSEHRVAAVITRDDSPQGRRRELTATPVAQAAVELDLPVIKANRLDDRVAGEVASLAPDLGVIVAYGGLVREPLLSTPRLGWINLHFSLLPRWRGAAPVQHALMAGDEITGASVFQLVPELDAGEVFGQLTQPIGAFETAGHLLESLAFSGAELLLRVVDALAAGTARSVPQSGDITFAPKLSLGDGQIEWTRDALTVLGQIRGVTPEPGAFTLVDGTRVKVITATPRRDLLALQPGALDLIDGSVVVGTGSHPIELETVHPAGKKVMRATDWWRGRASRPADGDGRHGDSPTRDRPGATSPEVTS